MTKHYMVIGSSGKWELDDRWPVASFTSRQKAEEWKERCEYYWKWIEENRAEALEEEKKKRVGTGIDDYDNPRAQLFSQWRWAILGTEQDQLRQLSEDFGENFSSWKDFERFYHTVPLEEREARLDRDKQEVGWMLSPYDPHLGAAWDWVGAVRYDIIEVEHDPPLPQDGIERDAKKLTLQALQDPQPGDRFHEMYSYWIYVVHRDGEEVWYCEANPPCSFPTDAKLTKTTVPKMFERFTTVGHLLHINPGKRSAWIRLSERGNDVSGWNREMYKEILDER